MTIVKQILGHHVTFGGESHSGWLPENAAVRKPTPTQDVALDITIESSGDGYLLCWSSPDNPFGSDLWFETLTDAEQAATEKFGVAISQWQTIA